MKKMFLKGVLPLAVAMSCPTAIMAQDDFETSAGADLVSGYLWRGQDFGGVSLQPSLSVAYKGLFLSAWGNVGFDSEDTKELDLTLGYGIGGFSVSVTDYWLNGGPGYFHYGARNTSHVYEAQLGYDFGYLNVNWYTNFAGCDGLNTSGDRAYSSYFSISAPFKFGGLDWNAEVGMVPWATTYYNDGASGFEVSNVSIGAGKEFELTNCTVPVSASLIWNPATEGAYFVVGAGIEI